MNWRFYKGFSIYENGSGPVYATPHSGPAIEIPTVRDDNSDTVASLCWIKTGGTLVIGTITRKRIWGVDYNRDPPPMKLAISMYPEFVADKNRDKLRAFRDRYAFVAKSRSDYEERLRIYNSFWSTVGNLGSVIILIHRKFGRIKNYPSVMDIVTYEGRGVDSATISRVVQEINQKYGKSLRGLAPYYKRFVMTETLRVVSRIERIFGGFGLENLEAEYKVWLKQDLSVIERLADPEVVQQLKQKFNKRNFLAAVRNVLSKKIPPVVTIENFFKGRKALSMKSKFFNRHFLIMEAEVNAFLGCWHPHLAANIITDIVNMLRGAKLYKHLGIRQTRMADFMT
ncbi:hypothetical protein DRJ48_02200 [Candidatus Woesearchaeota archaeon]|nr:hypothetical protein [Candidatus Woesearchaeota archaeon]RLE42992.1 MAG: hypothetical protein DRJ48_02200 [Candidatus Woesearchaeota archaeon]